MSNNTSNQKYHNKDKFKINRTGLIYDPLMLDFHCEWDDQYPEKPDRIKKPYERCQFYGLTEKCVNIPGRFCTDNEVEKCHTSRVNQLMKSCEKMNYDELKHISTQYDSMFFHKNSNKAARFALGSSIELMDNIMTGKIDNGFAIVRPPGHHAMHDEPNGYCYFNNAAITAKIAIEKYKLERVLIVDWDVHHGQSSQYLFYDDPRVLYFSLHRFDFGHFWPNLRQSDFDYIGEKDGKGYNINIPLNKIGFGNSEYLSSFYNLLLPILYEYKPELIIVSCGYDACIGCFEHSPQLIIVSCGFDSAIGDEKGKMKVTPAGYAHLINTLSCFSQSKLCVLLEGGYCIKSLSEGVALTVRALLGYPTPRIETLERPDPVFVQTLTNLITVLRPYWKSLQAFNDNDDIDIETFLKKWDDEYRKDKDIPFYSYEDRPKSFALTGFYPLYSDEDNARLDIEIDDLIKSTDLYVPDQRTCISLYKIDRNLLDRNNFIKTVELETLNESDHYENLLRITNGIASRKYNNGLAVLSLKDINQQLSAASNNAKSKFGKKVLTIQILDDLTKVDPKNDDSILNFVINSKKSNVKSSKNDIFISIDELNDASFITAFLRIVMPISYQFNPDLVIIATDSNVYSQKTAVTLKGLTQAYKLVCALANGNVILSFENNVDTRSTIRVIDASMNVLLGGSMPDIPRLVPDENAKVYIKSKIDELKNHWDILQFNEKLPKF